MFRNVLVGIDGSESAQWALRHAIDIVGSCGGRIGLVSVVPEPSLWIALPPFALPLSQARLAEELEGEAKRHLDEAEHAVPTDVPVTKLLARGNASEVLVTHALDGPWDLIVVGHRRSLDRWPIARRVGAQLLRSSPVPVLIVRGEVEASRRPAQPAPLTGPTLTMVADG